MTPLLLALLALVLAGPVPASMSAVPAIRRTPRSAMILWQAVALAAVLAALGASLSLLTDHAWRRPDAGLGGLLIAGVAGVITVLVVARLMLTGDRIGRGLRAMRRQHREQVDLVAERQAGLRLLDHDQPAAYCLPGLANSRVVVTKGALGRLSADELQAVVAHERAHLRARHDLVVEAFSVLHAAFPKVVSSAAALGEVRLLVEVLADRAAIRTAGKRSLAGALSTLAAGPPLPGGVALGAGGQLSARVKLLADSGRHPVQAMLLVALAGAIVVLPTVFVAAPWLASLAAG